MSWKLVVTKGPDTGREFLLPVGNSLLLGRSRRCDARLTDPHVSRIHCELEFQGEGVTLVALDTKNGTFVNDRPITEETLQRGDLLSMGVTELRLEAPDIHDQRTVALMARPETLPRERLGELAGKDLSHYAIGKPIATGNSGILFEAIDFKTNRTVAFKVLWPDFSKNEQDKLRFIRTTKTMLPHRHANLVTLYGAGKTGPYCWIAMEFVAGESLTEVIQRIGTAGMLDWRVAFRATVHVARALEYLRQQRIVHRDISPRNILIQSSDKAARLGGWMLAKAQEGPLAEEITKHGEVLGDIRYMSPERLVGALDLDARSDIYSLGATAYALLTGRVPCEGTTARETMDRIRTVEPIKPKKFQLAIPDLFEGTVLKMLAKRPDERYPTATALLFDLERVGKYQGVPV